MQPSYYEILGIQIDATTEEIKRAHREVARLYHPDIAGDTPENREKIVLVNAAATVLRNPDLRASYDHSRREAIKAALTNGLNFTNGAVMTQVTVPSEPSKRGPVSLKTPPQDTFANPQFACCEFPAVHCRPQCNPACPLQTAYTAFIACNFDTAWEFTERHLSQNPKSHVALELLGDIFARLARFDQAVTAYRSALELKPRDARMSAKLKCLEDTRKVSGTIERRKEAARPGVAPKQHATGSSGNATVPAVTPGSNGRAILLVEDNPIQQTLTSRLLRNHGFLVTVAPNGKEALKLVGRQKFDMVLMDVLMPVMNGLDATRAIRQCESKGALRVPIIALTGLEEAGDRERCLEAGMDFYVKKPLQPKDLLDTIRCMIS